MEGEKAQKVAKKIEVGANVAIIIVALAAILIFAKTYWKAPNGLRHNNLAAGAKFALKASSWQGHPRNVVLALSTTCRFCTESAEFYRELAQQCQKQNVPMIAVLPQPENESVAYLKGEGVMVNEIRQASLTDLQVGGTPTLLIVDSNGVIKNVWFGKLSNAQEKEVKEKLAS